MKKLLIFLCLLPAYLCCAQVGNRIAICKDEGIKLEASAVTNLHKSLNVQVQVSSFIISEDTITILDSFSSDTNNFYSLDSLVYGTTGTIIPGDTAWFNIYLTIDTANIPFYQKRLSFSNYIQAPNNDTIASQLELYVYITPWNEVEIWRYQDFIFCERQ